MAGLWNCEICELCGCYVRKQAAPGTDARGP